ncbi:MAG: DUF447 family protein [Desulfurococcales archaeon]|nr:DUF447 family protein [Desulfurococcales archaeon]
MVSCDASYSMPLGILGEGPYFFKIYKDPMSGEEKNVGGCLLLLAPIDPLVFYESIMHSLERRKELRDLDALAGLGSVFTCSPVRVGEAPEYVLYECDRLRPISIAPWRGYNRGYGCLVELLIIYSRVRAHVIEPDWGVLDYLLRCIERSIPGGGNIDNVARRLLQVIRGGL